MGTRRPNPELRGGTRYFSAALRFAGGTVLFLFGGLGLDRWIGTLPLFTIAGALIGAGLGFLSVYREFTGDRDRPGLKEWSGRRRDSGPS
jgi:F0F1-type ATP synthase assembly protein I